MRPFLVESKKSEPADIGDKDDFGGYRFWITNSYFEVEYPSFPTESLPTKDTFFVVYLIPRSESSFYVSACWEWIFKGWLEALAENKPVRDEVARTWPVFTQVLDNTLNGRWSQGVLNPQREDPDTGETKFFIETIVGNIDIVDFQTWYKGGVPDAMDKVAGISLLLLEEFATKKLSDLHIFKNTAWLAAQDIAFGLFKEYFGPSTIEKKKSNVSLRKPEIFQYFEDLRDI